MNASWLTSQAINEESLRTTGSEGKPAFERQRHQTNAFFLHTKKQKMSNN